MSRKSLAFVKYNFEAIFWLAGIILLALTDPADACHYSLCLFKNLGISFCPGCGLGRAIGYLLRGELNASFQAHPLGIPAFILLIYRIFAVFTKSKKMIKVQYSQN